MKLVRYNLYLFFGAIISIITIISYFLSFNSPELWSGASQIFELIYQFSIAYCVAYIFFVLQVWIPAQSNQDKAFAIIQEDLASLSYYLMDIVFLVDGCCTVEANELIINKNIYYFKRVNTQSENAGGWANCMVLSKDYLDNMRDTLDKLMQRITANEMYSQNDLVLIELLSKLQSSHFFRLLSAACDAKAQGVSVQIPNVKSDYADYKLASEKLWKMTHPYTQIARELNENERDFYIQRIGESPKIVGTTQELVWVKNSR